MRKVREITAEAENFRVERHVIKRDPVEPEPVGTIVLLAFRVVGYDPDCDGSLMARLVNIDEQGDTTGWRPNGIGLYPDTALVTTAEEWRQLHAQKAAKQATKSDDGTSHTEPLLNWALRRRAVYRNQAESTEQESLADTHAVKAAVFDEVVQQLNHNPEAANARAEVAICPVCEQALDEPDAVTNPATEDKLHPSCLERVRARQQARAALNWDPEFDARPECGQTHTKDRKDLV